MNVNVNNKAQFSNDKDTGVLGWNACAEETLRSPARAPCIHSIRPPPSFSVFGYLAGDLALLLFFHQANPNYQFLQLVPSLISPVLGFARPLNTLSTGKGRPTSSNILATLAQLQTLLAVGTKTNDKNDQTPTIAPETSVVSRSP